MVIYNLHVVRSGILPAETDAPLIVDPDRVLAGSIAAQLFQAVARRSELVAEVFCFVEVNQLASRGPLDRRRKLRRLAAFENVSGFIASETLDHCPTLSRCVTIGKKE
jgi:hypothetical protein